MKLIIAIIQPEELPEIKEELLDLKKEKSEQDNKTQVEKRKSKRKPHATPPDASE